MYLVRPAGHLPFLDLKEVTHNLQIKSCHLHITMHAHSAAQSYLTFCIPMDYSSPGSSVHGILQARILEWTAISSSSGSSQPGDRTRVSCIGRRILYH